MSTQEQRAAFNQLLREMFDIADDLTGFAAHGMLAVTVPPEVLAGDAGTGRAWLSDVKRQMPGDAVVLAEDGGPMRVEIGKEPALDRDIFFAVSAEWKGAEGMHFNPTA